MYGYGAFSAHREGSACGKVTLQALAWSRRNMPNHPGRLGVPEPFGQVARESDDLLRLRQLRPVVRELRVGPPLMPRRSACRPTEVRLFDRGQQ